MGQEVKDGDLVPRGGSIRQILLDWIVHTELAALFEQEDRRRGELLGDGPEPEFRVRRIGNIPFEIGEAVALAEEDLGTARHEHSSHERVVGDVGLNDLIHSTGVLRQARGHLKREQQGCGHYGRLPKMLRLC